jgi:hypothetical protein
MLKNFWPSICLILLISPLNSVLAASDPANDEEDYEWQIDRSDVFNDKNANMEATDIIREDEEPNTAYMPRTTPLKVKPNDCKKLRGQGEECEDIDISN